MSDETPPKIVPKLPAHLARGRGRGVFLNTSLMSSPIAPTGPSIRGGSIASQQVVSAGAKRGSTREDTRLQVYSTKPANVATKQGSSGKVVRLSANYFRLIKNLGFEYNLYRVDFEPVLDSEGLRKSLMKKHRQTLGGYLYDGGQQLYLTRRLPQEPIHLDCETSENKAYRITIRNTNRVIADTDVASMQILNLILRQSMGKLEMQLVGRNLYDAASKVEMPAFNLCLWPGFTTSIRQHEKEILICCDVSHKVMRQDTVYEVLRNCEKLGGDWKESFKRSVIGSVVLTDYNNKTYRVDDVNFDVNPSSTFETAKGIVSITDYYETKYNKTIKDKKQPLLVSKPKAKDVRANRDQILLLVPELCRATGLTDAMRANFTMMKDMAKHTQMDPSNRQKRLLTLVERLYNNPQSAENLKEFNTDIDKQLVSFSGRALPQDTMIFGDNKTFPNNDSVDWTNGFRNSSMYKMVDLKRWAFVYPKKFAVASEEFLKQMVIAADGMKYVMASPKMVELLDDRTSTYIEKLKELMAKDPKLIMIVLPNNAADRYAAIKKTTCGDSNAVPTQLIVGRTMTPKKGSALSIATKVVVQINCKLGGAAWMINFPAKVMVVGFDVARDTKDRNKSYGVFVASLDLKEKAQYYSAVSTYKNETEISMNIEKHLNVALATYREEHGSLPERIFFYRDGVSDGQVEYVHSTEVTRLNKRLEEIYGEVDQTPKMAFIIVNKRINTRIFRKSDSNVDNPVSGTVVDDSITLPERYDFFLISQAVRQGTVAPTSYNVIHDTSEWSADQVQRFTYKQTHLYYNWNGCVRVPAVCQYAKKLSILVSEFLHQLPSQEFKNQLYFL